MTAIKTSVGRLNLHFTADRGSTCDVIAECSVLLADMAAVKALRNKIVVFVHHNFIHIKNCLSAFVQGSIHKKMILKNRSL